MKSDQDIVYEAIRDAWLLRLREIDIRETVSAAIHNALYLNLYLEKEIDDTHSANTTKPKTKKSLAGMADATDNNYQQSQSESILPSRTSTKVSRTSFHRRRA